MKFLFTGLVYFFVTNVFFAQSSDGLVAKITFDDLSLCNEVNNDEVKQYNTLGASDRFGNSNCARYFQGNLDSYINLGTKDYLKPKIGTISIWIKVEQPVYKGRGFYVNPIIHTRSGDQEDFNEGFAVYYHFGSRKLHCNISVSELKPATVYPADVSYLRQWYHVAMTFDSTELKFYVNGLLEARTYKGFQNEYLKGDSILLGVIADKKNVRMFQGTIDDVLIYNRVLTSKEILDLFTTPSPKKTPAVFYVGFIFVLLLILFFFTQKFIRWRVSKSLKEEKEKNALVNTWYEQENKVLTAQMDPHFIFNSLNAIQQFIIVNDNEKAQQYLSKFSRLLRMILQNNAKDYVLLEVEIQILRKYIEIESLRFNDVFAYEIKIDSAIDIAELKIPRFLIQPFVENAIWHGLLPKEGEKRLTILFKVNELSQLSCVIEDNGVGRKGDPSPDQLEKGSFAIKFIRQRLHLMAKLYSQEYHLVITDLKDKMGGLTGTHVYIDIPVLK